ncbi:PLD-like domain protein [Chlamydia trachomatis]|nr:PLD-like domain protein [Chlamydia trachomatis]ROT57880.1 PLD-like domain protein [Chlamydia trachomatis]
MRVGSQQVSYYSLSQIRRDLCVKAILEANGIVLRERTCEGILHTKVCCIDSSTLIIGSVNWSRGGLTLNLEEFLIINPLTETQLECYNELWAYIETNSRLMTKELIQLHEKRKKSITDPKQTSSSTQDEENASTSAEQQF